MSTENNVTPLVSRGAESESDAAIADRVRRVFQNGKTSSVLGEYLLSGKGAETVAASAMDDCRTIATILAECDTKSDGLPDRAVPDLGFLQTRILDVARAVQSCEFDRRLEGAGDE